VVYRRLVADARTIPTGNDEADPGGHVGATTDSSADDPVTPMAVSSDKSLPGPATNHATPDQDPATDQPATDLPATEPAVTDLAAAVLARRAIAGAGPGLPLIAPARARRGSAVQGGPKGRRTATRSALDGGGAGPYQRGAGNPRAAAQENTGGEAATDQALNPTPAGGAQERAPTTP